MAASSQRWHASRGLLQAGHLHWIVGNRRCCSARLRMWEICTALEGSECSGEQAVMPSRTLHVLEIHSQEQ